ncbi:hypothetical protein MXB_3694, partial [Myxobolus squamalis]
ANELIVFQNIAHEKTYKIIFKEKYESFPTLNFLIRGNLVTFFLIGHEDWVKAISITKPPLSDYTLVSTCSQDRIICIWKISLSDDSKNSHQTINDLITKHYFSVQLNSGISQQFCVTKDSILLCHESRISAIDWLENAKSFPNLLSVGMDELIIIWKYDFNNNLWNEKVEMIFTTIF